MPGRSAARFTAFLLWQAAHSDVRMPARVRRPNLWFGFVLVGFDEEISDELIG